MRNARTLVSFVAGFSVATALSAGVATADAPAPREAVVTMLVQAQDELQALDRLSREVIDPNLRDRLIFRAARADAAIDESLRQIGRSPARPPVRPAIPVTNDAEFGMILGAVQRASFSDDKLHVLSSAARGRYFTTMQVAQVMGAFSFSSDKVDAASMLYPSVVDPQNWFLIYDHLTFSSDREELARRTGG